MKWKRRYQYIDLETGEVTVLKQLSKYEQDKTILIIRQTKKTKYDTYKSRLVEITKYYRRNKYRQPEIQYADGGENTRRGNRV